MLNHASSFSSDQPRHFPSDQPRHFLSTSLFLLSLFWFHALFSDEAKAGEYDAKEEASEISGDAEESPSPPPSEDLSEDQIATEDTTKAAESVTESDQVQHSEL